jgi:hypothetical protein
MEVLKNVLILTEVMTNNQEYADARCPHDRQERNRNGLLLTENEPLVNVKLPPSRTLGSGRKELFVSM